MTGKTPTLQLKLFPCLTVVFVFAVITVIVESVCVATEVALLVAGRWPPIALAAPIAFLGSSSAAYLNVLWVTTTYL